MSHRVHTHTHRRTNFLISSNVHYVHLGGDNKVDYLVNTECGLLLSEFIEYRDQCAIHCRIILCCCCCFYCFFLIRLNLRLDDANNTQTFFRLHKTKARNYSTAI